jgi:hypothetical protein
MFRRGLFFLVLLMIVFALFSATYAQDVPPESTPAPDVITIDPDGNIVDTSSTPFQNFLGTLSTMFIEALAPLIASVVFAILWRGYQFIKARLSVTQYQFLEYLVTTAVQAAEQTGLSNQIQNTGKAKKDFAIRQVMELLTARGYSDVAKYVPQIETLIEAAVNRGVQDYNKAILSPPASLS